MKLNYCNINLLILVLQNFLIVEILCWAIPLYIEKSYIIHIFFTSKKIIILLTIKNFERDIWLKDSFDSNNESAFIFILFILPIPEWWILVVSGVFEPIKINCPFLFLLSTSNLIKSQISSISCHSSINIGVVFFEKIIRIVRYFFDFWPQNSFNIFIKRIPTI